MFTSRSAAVHVRPRLSPRCGVQTTEDNIDTNNTLQPGYELQQRSPNRQSPIYTNSNKAYLVVHLQFVVVVNIHLNDDAVENDSDGGLINNMIRTLVLRLWAGPGSLPDLGPAVSGSREREE